MGLEGIEIVLAVEETFGITIPDADASRMQTPAELIAFIETHVPTVYSRDCLTQRFVLSVAARLPHGNPFTVRTIQAGHGTARRCL